MGWFGDRRRRRDEQLATIIASAVVQHLQQSAAPSKVDLNQALETLVVKKAESENTGAVSAASILMESAKTVMEYAVQTAFRRSRVPGGRARAATAKRHRGRFAPECRLCRNPLVADPRIEEILEHAKHGDRQSAARDIEVREDAVVAHVDEEQLQPDPEGGQRIECGDCADKKVLN